MGFIGELISAALENQGDFFTSGLSNAINNYYETKKLFTTISFIIGAVCLAALFIRAIFF